jgi:hypothetical protein
VFNIRSNLPNNHEWQNLVLTHELTEKADTLTNISSHLLSFDATLPRANVLSPDAAFFVTKKARGRTSTGDSTNGASRGQKSHGIVGHGCGDKGHIGPKC